MSPVKCERVDQPPPGPRGLSRAEQNAIRIEYEATAHDERILRLLEQLQRAEDLIARQSHQIAKLRAQLTRAP